MKTHVIASLKKVVSLVALNLFVASGAFAATTVLSFDDIAIGAIPNPYKGVSITGAVVVASSPQLPANSMPQLAYSEFGAMSLVFASSVGSVQSVSAYISGDGDTGIFAYDANGNLIGQPSLLGQASINTKVTFTSSSVPIARVEIHDGGSPFSIDDFSFTTAVTVPVCEAVNQNLYNSFKAIPDSLYKVPKTAAATRAAGLKLISVFDASLKSDVSNKVLLAQLAVIRAGADCALKPSTQKTQILQLIDSLIAKTKAGQC